MLCTDGLSRIDGTRSCRDGLAGKDATASFGFSLRGKGRRHHPGKYCDHPPLLNINNLPSNVNTAGVQWKNVASHI